jgi:hypothetical protein
VIKKEAENILKYKQPATEYSAYEIKKNRSDTNNCRGKRNHRKIIQKISEQHNWIAQHQ